MTILNVKSIKSKIFYFCWHFFKSYLVLKLAKKQDVCHSSPANDSNANSLKQMYAREAIEGSVYEISLPAGL